MSSDQNQRILQIQSVFQAGAFQTVFLASCINLPKMAHHQRSQLAFTTCPCKAAPGLLAYCGWESSCFPSSRELGSLEIKAKHACNYLQSLQRLTSGLLSEERTCQQKPADQKFRQQKEGRRRGGGDTYQAFIYPHLYDICQCTVLACVLRSEKPTERRFSFSELK